MELVDEPLPAVEDDVLLGVCVTGACCVTAGGFVSAGFVSAGFVAAGLVTLGLVVVVGAGSGAGSGAGTVSARHAGARASAPSIVTANTRQRPPLRPGKSPTQPHAPLSIPSRADEFERKCTRRRQS